MFKKICLLVAALATLWTGQAWALGPVPGADTPTTPAWVCLPAKTVATFADAAYDHCKREPAGGDCTKDNACAVVRCVAVGGNTDQTMCDARLPDCNIPDGACQRTAQVGALAPPEPAVPKEVTTLKARARMALDKTAITGPEQYVGQVVKFFTGAVGGLFLIYFIYAGFTWMIAFGNSEKIEQAKKTMLWATLGVVVVVASYLILDAVFQFIQVGPP